MSFQLYTSNKLEKLAELFAEKIYLRPPSDPFVPETVVVQTQGMAAYLKQSLAQHAPVAANVETPFLNHFFNRTLARLWPKSFALDAEASSERLLRWRIDAILAEEASSYPEIASYFNSGSRHLKRWQLAGRIAQIFDQYQIYRADVLRSWRDGGGAPENVDWQRRLFLQLSERGRRKWLFDYFDEFFRLESVPTHVLPGRVTLFGVGALPERYLMFFRKLAQFTEFHLFYLNPCCEYWSDQYSRREISRLLRRDGSGGGADFENGNPLLAALGGQGREFFRRIMELPESVAHCEAFESFVEYAPGEEPGPDSYRADTPLLRMLQQDIFTMCGRRSDGDGVVAGHPIAADPLDRSISVHNCHSERREVEILHDRLLDLLQDSSIQPRDVIVMAPDINNYAPAIEAVFGRGPLAECYAIADRAPGAGRIRDAFLALLETRNGRFETVRVAELFGIPAISRRFGLNGESIALVNEWLEAADIRWGVDGADRKSSCGVAFEEYSWRLGLDRLLCGIAMETWNDSDSDEGANPEASLPLPVGNIGADDAVAFGRFLEFLEKLFALKGRLAEERPPREWSRELLNVLDAFFLASADDFEEFAALRGALLQLEEDAARTDYEQPLPLEGVLEYLNAVWSAPGRSDPFLRGRITFCSLVPMRSVPMSVVALLGLKDGEFPRRDLKTGFNLLEISPRAGDRSRVREDRYLFLEAIQSARRALLIFYQGQTARGEDRFPPAVPLVELLDYLKSGFHFEETEHRLQAFDFQYFTPGAGADFRSYSQEDFLAAQTLRTALEFPETKPAQTEHRQQLHASGEAPEVLTLEELERFFRAPAASFLRERAGLFFSDAPDVPPESEPFQLDALELYQLRTTMLTQLLAGISAEEGYRRLRFSNRLPAGEPGKCCFAAVREELERLPAAYRVGLCRMHPRQIRVECGTMVLSGSVSLSRDERELLLISPSTFRARHLLGGTLRQLAATAAGVGPVEVRMLNLEPGGTFLEYRLAPVSERCARERLEQLFALYRRGWCEPLPFFQKSSFAAAEAKGAQEEKLRAAERKFRSANFADAPPGDLDDPAIGRCFEASCFAEPEFQEEFLRLAQVLFPEIPEGVRCDGE